MHAASKPQLRRQRRMIPILPFLQPYFVNLQQLLMSLPGMLSQQDDHQTTVIQMQRLLNEMILRVQRLVLLQSIEAQGEVRMDEIQIGKLIQQVLMELRGQNNKRDVRFNVEIPESFAALYCNVSQVRMALRELLENVIQHATDSSDAWIQVCQRQGYVHLSVRDNGHGIGEEKLVWLQGWFAQQDDNSRIERYEHIGFGLALVRAVAKAHHGDLRVESGSGIGSTFTLILPAVV
jgi:signal transduction histidine kinase